MECHKGLVHAAQLKAPKEYDGWKLERPKQVAFGKPVSC